MSSMLTGFRPTSESNASTSSSKFLLLSNRMRTPVKVTSRGSDADMVYLLGIDGYLFIANLVDVGGRCAIDQQAEQLLAAVVPAGIHLGPFGCRLTRSRDPQSGQEVWET